MTKNEWKGLRNRSNNISTLASPRLRLFGNQLRMAGANPEIHGPSECFELLLQPPACIGRKTNCTGEPAGTAFANKRLYSSRGESS